jgi:putative restriction endonuclease
VHGFIANTDYDWYTFLRGLGPLEEVNFWQPSAGQGFGAIPAGSPFFFKLKRARQFIAGFGSFANYSRLPAWLAWDAFGVRNGAPDFETMRRRIEKYRPREKRDPRGEYIIGCLMISQPVFFSESEWIPAPIDWAPNIVRGKTYDLETGDGRRIWEQCKMNANALGVFTIPGSGESIIGDRYGKPILVKPRLGQGTFRISVTDAYGRACAITNEHSLPALDAAHIKPYVETGPHEITNGILLRSDIHKLFDKGYVTVTGEYKFEVSRKLKDDYENGRSYYPLTGKKIQLPAKKSDWPDPVRLQWHNENKFRI